MQKMLKPFRVACAFWPFIFGCVSAGSAADLVQSSPALTISVQRYGEHDNLCLAWTDGCVACSQNGCSNIGIACEPKKITCTQRQMAPAK